MLQFMGSQWVGHVWVTELNWIKSSVVLPSKSQAFFTGVKTGLNDLLLTNSMWCRGWSVISEMRSWKFTLWSLWNALFWGSYAMLWRCPRSLLELSNDMELIRSVAQSCPTLCDPMNRSTPGLPVQHQLPEFTETHVHRVSDVIQPSHPLSCPSPLAPNPSQHQSLFQWVNSSHEVAKVLEFQL